MWQGGLSSSFFCISVFLFFLLLFLFSIFFPFFHLPTTYLSLVITLLLLLLQLILLILQLWVFLRNQVEESSKQGIQAAWSTPIHHLKWWISRFRGAYRTHAASKVELFVILVAFGLLCVTESPVLRVLHVFRRFIIIIIIITTKPRHIISSVNKKQIYSTYPMSIYVELAFGGHCLHFQVYTINSVI